MRRRLILIVAVLVGGMGTWFAVAQSQREPAEIPSLVPPEGEEIKEGVWKNVQLLGHLSIPDLNKVMAFFRRPTGTAN